MASSWTLSQASVICQLLTVRDAGRCSATSSTNILARTASAPVTWQNYLGQIFGAENAAACKGVFGEDCQGDWKAAFKLWHKAARTAGACGDQLIYPLSASWIAPLCRLRHWLEEHSPEVYETLQPGVPDSTWSALESQGLKVAPLVRGLWEFIDGQSAPVVPEIANDLSMPELGDEDNWALGIFGGYAAYDHEVSTVLLPIEAAVKLTTLLRGRVPALRGQHAKLVFACSFNLSKFMLVDVVDGSIYTLGVQGALEVAAPSAPNVADGLLRWVTEFSQRLVDGAYAAMPLRPEYAPSYQGISLFAMCGPALSRCETRGVIVTGTPIYMPEAPQGWTYSITLELTSTPEERGYETCQLHTREWEIEDHQGNVDRIRGEGVIGFKPILADGGWKLNPQSDPHGQYRGPQRLVPGPFRYQSCSGRTPGMRGKFGGTLTFVPGTIRKPTAPAFEARLEPFVLQVPEFIF